MKLIKVPANLVDDMVEVANDASDELEKANAYLSELPAFIPSNEVIYRLLDIINEAGAYLPEYTKKEAESLADFVEGLEEKMGKYITPEIDADVRDKVELIADKIGWAKVGVYK